MTTRKFDYVIIGKVCERNGRLLCSVTQSVILPETVHWPHLLVYSIWRSSISRIAHGAGEIAFIPAFLFSLV